MSILEVNNVSKSFGGVKANVDISMSVEKGKIFGLAAPFVFPAFKVQLSIFVCIDCFSHHLEYSGWRNGI